MPIRDENVDPLYQKMVDAWEGDPVTWGRINRALRDAMVDHAVRRSPYYRKVVPAGGGFRDIPILTKSIVREHLDDLLAEGIPEGRPVPKRTSGSTGEPGSFYRDASQGPIEYVSAQRFLRRLHGVEDGVTMVWITTDPPQPPSSGHPVRRVALVRSGPRKLRLELRRWARRSPYFLYGPASSLQWVAEQMRSEGLAPSVPPVCAITTGDALTGPAQRQFEEVFGCPVHSWYGSHELNGYVGGTLPGTRRYAINPLLVHAEVLRDDGEPAAPGEMGRLILTDLNNYVMPLIRYDIGDIAVASPRGTKGGWPLLDDLVGRSSEVLRLPSGRVVTPVNLNNRLFVARDLGAHVRYHQCAQTGPNRFELRVVWRGRPSPEVRRALEEGVRDLVDPDSQVTVTDVDEPDRLPSGKPWIARREL